MLINTINGLIPSVMKERNAVRLNSLKMIKTELVKAKTSGEKYDEGVEQKLLTKMVKQYSDAIKEFEENNAMELAEQYKQELAVIKEFAPQEASEEEIIAEVDKVIADMIERGVEPHIKELKNVISAVKTKYPTADGTLISLNFRKKVLGK